MKKINEGVFKPSPTRTEAKGDATTRIAREIMDREESARVQKTRRLRAARQALEDEQAQALAAMPAPAPMEKTARKRSPAKTATKSAARQPAKGSSTTAKAKAR